MFKQCSILVFPLKSIIHWGARGWAMQKIWKIIFCCKTLQKNNLVIFFFTFLTVSKQIWVTSMFVCVCGVPPRIDVRESVHFVVCASCAGRERSPHVLCFLLSVLVYWVPGHASAARPKTAQPFSHTGAMQVYTHSLSLLTLPLIFLIFVSYFFLTCFVQCHSLINFFAVIHW